MNLITEYITRLKITKYSIWNIHTFMDLKLIQCKSNKVSERWNAFIYFFLPNSHILFLLKHKLFSTNCLAIIYIFFYLSIQFFGHSKWLTIKFSISFEHWKIRGKNGKSCITKYERRSFIHKVLLHYVFSWVYKIGIMQS